MEVSSLNLISCSSTINVRNKKIKIINEIKNKIKKREMRSISLLIYLMVLCIPSDL